MIMIHPHLVHWRNSFTNSSLKTWAVKPWTVQSHRAFIASSIEDCKESRVAQALNGEVVSESEPECVSTVNSEVVREGSCKEAANGYTKKSCKMASKIEGRAEVFIEKWARELVSYYKNVGIEIELFVQYHNIGVDAWRHTGMLTFDGNVKLGNKVKDSRTCWKHFNRKVSYGSIVELCVPRRCSAKRYKD